jgi:hypothetical protein
MNKNMNHESNLKLQTYKPRIFMLGYIEALVMDLATHNGKETKTELGKHNECHKSRKTLFLKFL